MGRVFCGLSGPLRVPPWTPTRTCLITIRVVDRTNKAVHRDFGFGSSFEEIIGPVGEALQWFIVSFVPCLAF